MGKKSIKIVKVLTFLLPLLVSCKQSCFDVLSHNDVGYWSFNWTHKEPYGSIVEFSKKDSTMKYIDDYDDNWAYQDWNHAFWGLKFRIINDTLFSYVDRKGYVMVYDTLSIVSYSKNKFISNEREAENVKWHRISTKYARKMMNSQVKLSFLLKRHGHDKKITDITDVVWKLYGYGDVSTGIVKKSESLKYDWMSVIKFWKNDIMSGQTTYDDFCGKYVLSGSNIEFLSFEKKDGRRESYDGKEFCDVLPQCKRFKITNNWLQLFYNDGKNFLLFKVAKNFK